ncbi:MAG: hypothetical protein HY331_17570 [Chloroflexi bacterium]|nr:hypothetical protein [Chloroflexota bacterium]
MPEQLNELSGWVTWPISLVVGFVLGMLLGRYLRMRQGWLISDIRSLLRPLLVAVAAAMALLILLTAAAAAAGYVGDFNGAFSLELALLFTLSTRLLPEEPWWKFWRWRRPPPPLTRKQKKRRRGRR